MHGNKLMAQINIFYHTMNYHSRRIVDTGFEDIIKKKDPYEVA